MAYSLKELYRSFSPFLVFHCSLFVFYQAVVLSSSRTYLVRITSFVRKLARILATNYTSRRVAIYLAVVPYGGGKYFIHSFQTFLNIEIVQSAECRVQIDNNMTTEQSMKENMQSRSSRQRKFLNLNWNDTPSRSMPHGLWGIISVLIGLYLIIHSISGRLQPYMYHEAKTPPTALIMYAISTALNAVAGYRLAAKAPLESRSIFKKSALLQICLVYYILRFSSYFSSLATAITLSRSNDLGTITSIMQITDHVSALSTLLCILSFQKTALNQWEKSKCISIGVSIGSMALLLLAVYPIQLSMFGQDWWDCIQQRYQAQNIAMVAYIYVPATVTFSFISFCATLYLRGILSDIEFGVGSAAIVMVCLIGTVLSQEVHVPDISTQRIYLPCLEPAIGSKEFQLVKALDFSKYARMILTYALNIEFETKLYK